MLAALLGAWVLGRLAQEPMLVRLALPGLEIQVAAIKLTIGVLILSSVVIELLPCFARVALGPKHLPLGGVISGLFGGLSGHQVAFRSMFLLKVSLDAPRFVAFAGAWLGARWLRKVTLGFVRTLVAALLVLVALGLVTGLL